MKKYFDEKNITYVVVVILSVAIGILFFVGNAKNKNAEADLLAFSFSNPKTIKGPEALELAIQSSYDENLEGFVEFRIDDEVVLVREIIIKNGKEKLTFTEVFEELFRGYPPGSFIDVEIVLGYMEKKEVLFKRMIR